jgi:hypothetical protein
MCANAIDDSLKMVNDFQMFEKARLRETIFCQRAIRSLLRIVSVRCAPWNGLFSMGGFEIEYWSDYIADKVSYALLRLIYKRSKDEISGLLSWSREQDRVLVGCMVEKLFHRLAVVQGISCIFMERIVRNRERNELGSGIYKVEEPNLEWIQTVLCGPMKRVRTQSLPTERMREGKDCYYEPPSPNQRMYDAVIIHENEEDPVEVLQITVGDRHGVRMEEFKNLFDWRNKENKPLNFRFLMVRVARDDKDWNTMKASPMYWWIPNSTKEIRGILEQVRWFECVFNLQKALVDVSVLQLSEDVLK